MSGSSPRDPATARVWSALPDGTREALDGLGPSDLQTLLTEVLTRRADRVTAADVRRRWETDRFVTPSASDPRALSAFEARLWPCVPADVDAVELSPVTPFGTCAALAGIGQERIVSTTRGSEVVSDSTTTLALEAARRRRAQPPEGEVHLAAGHRQLRAQPMGGASAHFRLLTLVSSARDRGSGVTEADLLVRHLGTWQAVLAESVPALETTIEISAWSPVLAERVADRVRPALGARARSAVVDDPGRTRAKGYYTDLALRLEVAGPDGPVEVGDGGLTDWTATLTENRKERCLVSCVSTERLLALAGG
jgi:hypothetical protein